MAVWLIRAGKMGIDEDMALQKCVGDVGWTERPDKNQMPGVWGREGNLY